MKRCIPSLLILTALISWVSCTSGPPQVPDRIVIDQKSDHKVNVEFDGKCAEAIASGNFDALGRAKYRLEYQGKTYLFATQEAKDRFIRNLNQNLARADSNWADHEGHGSL